MDRRDGVDAARSALGKAPASSSNLDLLRALAVLFVFADHLLETVAIKYGPDIHPYDWYLGRVGVLLFFVHTTLVLLMSMERAGEAHPRSWGRFYIRRFFRLYPLSIAIILLVVALQIPIDPWKTFEWFGWTNLASNLALTTNLTADQHLLSPLWTLPYEIQLYLVLPFVFWLITRFPSMYVLVSLYVLAVGVELAYLFFQPELHFGYLQPYFAPCFMAGALAFVLQRKAHALVPAGCWLPFLLIASLAYMALDNAAGVEAHTPYVQWLFCLVVGISIPWFQQLRDGWLTKAASLVARYSYGIYMSHCIGLWLGFYVFWMVPLVMQILIGCVVTALFSFAAFHLIEQPAIALGKHIASGRGARLRSSGAGLAGQESTVRATAGE